jgi:hypothetical protein
MAFGVKSLIQANKISWMYYKKQNPATAARAERLFLKDFGSQPSSYHVSRISYY